MGSPVWLKSEATEVVNTAVVWLGIALTIVTTGGVAVVTLLRIPLDDLTSWRRS